MIHRQVPLPVPCYDFSLINDLTLSPYYGDFGYCHLSCCDGRWVQDSGTYSSLYGWLAITSDSSFMRSGFRPQSELGNSLMGLAPRYRFATHCQFHCTTCAAQSIKGPRWFGVILTFLPVIQGSPLWQLKHRVRVAHVTPFKGASQDTCWRQPCSTWANVLVGIPAFPQGFTSFSSPGKVPRLSSN